jgi:hypothetical protein
MGRGVNAGVVLLSKSRRKRKSKSKSNRRSFDYGRCGDLRSG